MKIGMILDEKYPPHPRVKNEAVNLIEGGHEVVLFCLDYTGEAESEIMDGLKVVRYKTGNIVRKFSALAYSIFIYRIVMQYKVKRFIREQKPDALHIHNIRIGKAVLKAIKGYNGKIILDLHENIPEIMKMYHHVTHFPGNVLIYPSRWKKWEKKLVHESDKIVVVTEEAKDDLMENYGVKASKILIVPNSVQPSFYLELDLKQQIIKRFESSFSLFYFGDTGIRRGLETAIRSLVKLKDAIPAIKLIIVGSSKSDPFLKKLTADLGVSDYVSFEGFQDEGLLQSYISASDICISPLLRNRHHDTTYANKIFQYMALGKPLIVSDCPAQKRIVKEAGCGLVFEAGNIEDFSDKVLSLYNDKGSRSRLGHNGSVFIRDKYNQAIKSKELIEFYHSIS